MFGKPLYCAECTGSVFHVARSKRVYRIARLLLLTPFRCRACGALYWRLALNVAAPTRHRSSRLPAERPAAPAPE